jgi:hypothetical protein
MATYRTRTARDGSTSVHVQVRMTGYPARTASFGNKREAQKWAATVEADMIEGRHFKDAAGRKRTMAEAIKRFRLEVLPLEEKWQHVWLHPRLVGDQPRHQKAG